MGNDCSPESEHNDWRYHYLRCSKAGNSELETGDRMNILFDIVIIFIC